MSDALEPSEKKSLDFIRKIINHDLETNKHNGRVETRFPPEPNGYLHIGHAKSINLNFGIARDYNGACHLRFDDTNPEKEENEYIQSIQEDVQWLGFDWQHHLYYASDYYDRFFEYAKELIQKGLAYVCHLSADEIRQYRGTLTEKGKNSPYRDRSPEENLRDFDKMKNGDYDEGACVLRAKIDMASPNMNMRDPALYRIRKATHPRTGNKWCIYPMYDFAHCISDAIENITHSICTLEFEDHRPLYDWVLENISTPSHPQQIEFARLNLTYTVMSKRKLLQLVKDHDVNGWDDPRMPTISGLRRRGYSPEAIRAFCEAIGVDKTNSTIDIENLEYHLREDLNQRAQRVMAVLNPLKIVITNYPDGQVEDLTADNNPENPSDGTRMIPFSKELFIERNDFMEDPPKKWFRLAPGREVRLKHAYYVTCDNVLKNEQGEVVELHCSYDPQSRGGGTPDGRKVKGTLHWVSCQHALEAEVRLYDRLFLTPNPEKAPEGKDFKSNLNPASLTVLRGCKVEPSLGDIVAHHYYQFLRHGYFYPDKTSTPSCLVFNRTVTLKDSWAKLKDK